MLLVGISLHATWYPDFELSRREREAEKEEEPPPISAMAAWQSINSHCLHLGGVDWTLALLGFPNRRDEDGMVKPVQNWEVVMILQGNTWYKPFFHYQWENTWTWFFQKSFPIELKILIMVPSISYFRWNYNFELLQMAWYKWVKLGYN